MRLALVVDLLEGLISYEMILQATYTMCQDYES